MKSIAIIMFGVASGVLSSFFGLNWTDEPVKYAMINFPIIACFVCVVNILPDKE